MVGFVSLGVWGGRVGFGLGVALACIFCVIVSFAPAFIGISCLFACVFLCIPA